MPAVGARPLPDDRLKEMLHHLKLCRYFDERMEALYRQGRLPCAIYSGPCQGLSPMQIIHKIVHDARDFNQDHPGYGFIGDPTHPRGTRYYGYLIHPGSY